MCEYVCECVSSLDCAWDACRAFRRMKSGSSWRRETIRRIRFEPVVDRNAQQLQVDQGLLRRGAQWRQLSDDTTRFCCSLSHAGAKLLLTINRARGCE